MANELEKKAKELFMLAKQVAHNGYSIECGDRYCGSLDGVTYQVNNNISLGYDDITVSTEEWGVSFNDSIDLEGKRQYEAFVWKGNVPDNLDEILNRLTQVPDQGRRR